MADYLVLDTELSALASAIRSQTGTSGSLTYPAGFANAIASINDFRSYYCYGGSEYPTVYNDSQCISIKAGAFVAQNVTSVYFPNCVTIGSNAFAQCSALSYISFPECTTVNAYAFSGCSALTSINFPKCTFFGDGAFYSCVNISVANFSVTSLADYLFWHCEKLVSVSFSKCIVVGDRTFMGCSSLTSVYLPVCTTLSYIAFGQCSLLTSISLPKCTTIDSMAFWLSPLFSTIYLANNSVVALTSSNAFTGTLITSTTGSIKVPSSLVNAYKTATAWSYFSNRIFAI